MKTSEVGIKSNSTIYFSTPSNRAKTLFYYITCTGHFYYEKCYRLFRENYDSILIMLILNGSAKVEYGEKTYIAKKGDIVLLDCYEPHGYEAIDELETLWFHFDGLSSREICKSYYEQNGCILNSGSFFSVLKNTEKIYQALAEQNRTEEAMSSAYVSRIIAEFFSTKIENETKITNTVEESIQFMKVHYGESIGVKEIAKSISLSEYYFSRVFRKETGFTPYEYLTNLRINEAKHMLNNSEKSIYEIALQCGFSTEGNFIRTFKKQTNQTPGAFRKIKW